MVKENSVIGAEGCTVNQLDRGVEPSAQSMTHLLANDGDDKGGVTSDRGHNDDVRVLERNVEDDDDDGAREIPKDTLHPPDTMDDNGKGSIYSRDGFRVNSPLLERDERTDNTHTQVSKTNDCGIHDDDETNKDESRTDGDGNNSRSYHIGKNAATSVMGLLQSVGRRRESSPTQLDDSDRDPGELDDKEGKIKQEAIPLAAAVENTAPPRSSTGIGARVNLAFAALAPKGLIERWAADVDDAKDEHINVKNKDGSDNQDPHKKKELGIYQHVDIKGDKGLDAKREENMAPMYVAGNDQEYYDIQRRESFIEFMLDYDEDIDCDDFDDGYRGIRINDDSDGDEDGLGGCARVKGGGKRQVVSDYGCVTKEMPSDQPANESLHDQPLKKVMTNNVDLAATKTNTGKGSRPIKEENEQLRRWVKELTEKVTKLQSSLEDKDEEKKMWQQSAVELQAQLNELRK